MKIRKTYRKAAGTILAAAMTVLCGGLPAHAAAAGDLNGSGSTDRADVLLLRSWLTGESAALSDRQAADLNADDRLDAADLTLLKRSILEKPEELCYIHLKDSGITYEGGHITVSGKTAVIDASGTYYIDGSISGGQILVQVPDETADAGTVKLFLSGVTMTNSDAPCIMVENAEKTSVNLAADKGNTLSDGKGAPADAEAEPAFAVLHAKDDLTVKGEGSLTIHAGAAYGIHCNNDLKLNGGSLNVTTGGFDAVRGRTSVNVKDGTLFIDSEGDGIKSTKGSLSISGGTVQIKSGKDALQSETEMSLRAVHHCEAEN